MRTYKNDSDYATRLSYVELFRFSAVNPSSLYFWNQLVDAANTGATCF